MNLIELISYFRLDGDQEEFFLSNSLDPESEVIEVYMERPFDISKEIKFFEIETTEGNLEFEYNNVKYFNLFDFYFFADFIEESKSKLDLSDKEFAVILLNYSINDT